MSAIRWEARAFASLTLAFFSATIIAVFWPSVGQWVIKNINPGPETGRSAIYKKARSPLQHNLIFFERYTTEKVKKITSVITENKKDDRDSKLNRDF